MQDTLKISDKLLAEISMEAVKCYPHEACGFLIGTIDIGVITAREFSPCKNIQQDLHVGDPERYPRTAATAYVIDPAEHRKIEEEAAKRNLRIVAIVHSHPEHEAYFSTEDKANAAPWGEPLFPGVSYVVASVFDKRVKTISEFYWDESKQDFLERRLYGN